MRVLKPLEVPFIRHHEVAVFLAGSIEMGKAEDWQSKVTNQLAKEPDADKIVILNPRRDDWDSSWIQPIENQQFRHQVNWELLGLERADLIALYLSPGTKSPISLLELGLFRHKQLAVCCPEGFWRKGNVEIVCDRYGIRLREECESWLHLLSHLVYSFARAKGNPAPRIQRRVETDNGT